MSEIVFLGGIFRKLSKSEYADNFVLKGGLFIYTLINFESRATVDVDFLMRGLNYGLSRMDKIISDILAVPTGNDFMTFKAAKMEKIALQRKYHGVSTQITGYIKNVRVPFNVDIGVGDVIVPNPEKHSIQTEEHTVQLDRKTAKRYQLDFKNKKINILSCPTTFEMGIDIGDLETVFMGNVPPTPANYVQRAGRTT